MRDQLTQANNSEMKSKEALSLALCRIHEMVKGVPSVLVYAYYICLFVE